MPSVTPSFVAALGQFYDLASENGCITYSSSRSLATCVSELFARLTRPGHRDAFIYCGKKKNAMPHVSSVSNPANAVPFELKTGTSDLTPQLICLVSPI